VPRLRRLPVDGFFLREYRRYCPDFSLRIILKMDATQRSLRCHQSLTGIDLARALPAQPEQSAPLLRQVA
jgi:hypothetical protein